MRYWIEYADGRCCNFANSRKDLLDWLKLLKDEKIVDIRKIYKSGVTDSVIDSYGRQRSWIREGAEEEGGNEPDKDGFTKLTKAEQLELPFDLPDREKG